MFSVTAHEACNIFGLNPKIVEDYKAHDDKYYSYHCWVDVGKVKFDLASEITGRVVLISKGVLMPVGKLVAETPKNFERMDNFSIEEKLRKVAGVFKIKEFDEFWWSVSNTSVNRAVKKIKLR